MSQRYTGIEIGSRQIKMAQCVNNCVYRVAIEPLPDNYVDKGTIVSIEAMSETLKEMARKYHFTDKNCAVVLPDSVAFSRRLTMPAMTVDQLKINLPYEFHDFISDSKKGYVFDYSVLEMTRNEEGRPVSMDLMAAAAPREKIQEYEMMLKRAGFKLSIAAPEVFAFSNMIREHEAVERGEKEGIGQEYCFIDIGYNYTKIHIFTGCRFEVTREIEYGCSLLHQVVADEFHVDEHVARSYVVENYKKVWDMQRCRDIYETIAVEVMRAINFYGFNNPSSQLDTVYFCGGGSMIPNLVEAIADQITLRARPISELFTVVGEIPDEAFISPAAAGITFL